MRTPPPHPRDDLQFSNTTGIPQKKNIWFIGVEVEQETSAPPPKKNPGSAPEQDFYYRFAGTANNSLSNIDFPKITRRYTATRIIAFTSASYVHPMIRGYKGNEIVQSTFSIHSVMTPFSNIIRASFISPLIAKSCQSRVVIVHSDKRATRSRESICSTAKELDDSFAFGISGRSDVECSSRSLFLAKESYLSERQDLS